MSPNSAIVVSNPSSLSVTFVASSPSTRLVVSISRDVSGSAVTGSIRLSTTGSGSGSGSGSRSGSGAGLARGGGAPPPLLGDALVDRGGATPRENQPAPL